MYGDVTETSADVENTDITARLRVNHKIGEAEERVDQCEHGHFIEGFNVVCKAWFERFEPLQKEAHEERGVAQCGKLTQNKVSHKEHG